MKSKKLLSLLLVAAMSITCLTACGKKNEVEPTPTPVPAVTPTPAADTTGLNAAKDYINNMYASKDGSATATASDYSVVGVVKIDGVTYNIEWTTDAKSGVTIGAMDSKKMVNIDVDEKTKSQVDYTLTATIKDANGNKVSASFKHYVPAYKELSYAEYAAAEKGATVVVKGVVTALLSKANGNSSYSVYFQDENGGYYAYNIAEDHFNSLNLKPGMTIQVTGQRDTYSGTYEIVNAKVEVLDSSIKKVTPADYTEIFKKAATLKDKSLAEPQSILVTLKGVEIIGIGSDPTYYMFQLGDKQSYVRISSSSCPIGKDDQAKFIDTFNSHIGYIADVTGLLTLYDGAFYISPISADAFTNLTLPKRTDAEMVEFEKGKLTFPARITEDTVLDLVSTGATYKDVSIVYYIKGALHEGDKLPITQTDNEQTIEIKAELKCNDKTAEALFTVIVEAKASDLCEAEVLSKAFALADGQSVSGKQVLRGKIVEIPSAYSEQYKNITVNMQVGDKIVQAYRMVGGADLKIGDTITVTGVLKNYKGTVEFDKGCTYSKTLSVDEAKQLITVEKAFELTDGKALSGKKVICGKIVEIPSD